MTLQTRIRILYAIGALDLAAMAWVLWAVLS